MVQVLIPISNNSLFFPKEEFYFPKPIIDVLNKPLIVQVVKHIEKALKPTRFICVIPNELEKKWSLAKIISLSIDSKVDFYMRNENTSGSLCSSLLASDLLGPEGVIVVNMDEIIDANLFEIVNIFKEKNYDAGLITYNDSHPRLSYALINEKNTVEFCAEKMVISKNALTGFYYFSSRDLFIDSCAQSLINDDSFDGNFYLSSAINQIILANKKVGVYKINKFQHHSLYSPEMIKEFEKSQFAKKLSTNQKYSEVINIVIPAAGEGSRFKSQLWKSPKPFIDINGKPMLQHVIDNISLPNSNIYLILRDNQPDFSKNLTAHGSNIISKLFINYKTSGTACTLLHAKEIIDNQLPLIIANSDQIVDFDCKLFIQDAIERNLDGSILVFKDKFKSSKWSFAKMGKDQYVEKVAEKNPISDLATVGIYYFKFGSDFINGALEMIKHDDRVNNEFYTCPVYNYLIIQNKKIGIFEIDQDCMNGVGTPEDLNIYLNKKGYKKSIDEP